MMDDVINIIETEPEKRINILGYEVRQGVAILGGALIGLFLLKKFKILK